MSAERLREILSEATSGPWKSDEPAVRQFPIRDRPGRPPLAVLHSDLSSPVPPANRRPGRAPGPPSSHLGFDPPRDISGVADEFGVGELPDEKHRFVQEAMGYTRSEGVTDAVATPKDSGGGR